MHCFLARAVNRQPESEVFYPQPEFLWPEPEPEGENWSLPTTTTGSFLAAIAAICCACLVLAVLLVEDGLIMGSDYGFDVGHAAVVQFNGVSVKDLVDL